MIRQTVMEQADARRRIADRRPELYERFKAVIHGAGYNGAQAILDEWFEEYLKDIPEFEKMLVEYETRKE